MGVEAVSQPEHLRLGLSLFPLRQELVLLGLVYVFG